MTKRTDPPVPIMDVLHAALKALDADGRFRRVPNGYYEVAWRQPSKGRNGEGDRPARYALTIECGFGPHRASRSAAKGAQTKTTTSGGRPGEGTPP